MNKKVAVLLATYNGRSYVSEQLHSISAQSDVSSVVYLSDDVSRDGTVAAAMLACSRFQQKVTLVSSPRDAGLVKRSSANNFYHLIINVEPPSDVSWVAFADQDDVWKTCHLSRAIRTLQMTGASGYSSSVCAFWPDGRRRFVKKHGYVSPFNHLFESPGPGCSIVLPRSAYNALQVHLRNNVRVASQIEFHDWAIYAFIRSSGQLWFIDSYPSLFYRQHDSNVLGVQLNRQSLDRRFRLLFGNWYRQQCLAVACFCGQSSAKPILRLSHLSIFDRLLLFFMAFTLRRRTRDRLLLSIAFFVMRN